MPKKIRKSKKRTKPNVFVQNKTSSNINEESQSNNNSAQAVQTQNKNAAVEIIPTNYFAKEIKKMGIIATSMIIILAVLTIVLG